MSRSLPADAMMGPTPQGPWMPVYAVASERTGQIGTLPGLAIIAVASVAFTAFLLWMSGSSPKPKPAEPLPAAPAVTAAPVPTSDGRAGIRRAVCPMKAFPCSVSGPDGTVMTIDNGVGCPMTATMFVKDGRESLNQMGFLTVRCPTGQEWRAPTFARVP